MLLNIFRELGARLTQFTERWVPDSWVICMMLTALAIVLCIFGAGAGVEEGGQGHVAGDAAEGVEVQRPCGHGRLIRLAA